MTLTQEWLDRLRPEVGGYAAQALDNIGREFPSYPVRTGLHANTSFGLSLALPWARRLAAAGQIAHLHGLNLSRAWCFRRLAETLPPGDPRIPACTQASRRHAEASLPHVTGDDYLVTHWLAAYAVLLFS